MFQLILDLLFPIHCVGCRRLGNHLCKTCLAQVRYESRYVCIVCKKANILGVTHQACKKRYGVDAHINILHYNPVLKRALSSVKYHGSRQAYASLLWVLEPELKKALDRWSDIGLISNEKTAICPIPLHRARQRARGFNQSEDLARCCCAVYQLPLIPLLNRTTHTPQVAKLPHDSSRRFVVKGAFSLAPSYDASTSISTVILIDDVVTTGATVEEAARVLKRAGVLRVYVLSLARG